MKRAGCANTVQERFTAINGVESLNINLDNIKAVLESQTKIDNQALDTALADTNYSVVNE